MCDSIILPSGKELYAHCKIIGINDKMEVSEGYDGHIAIVEFWPTIKILLLKKEREELADMTIERWKKFRELEDEFFLKGERE